MERIIKDLELKIETLTRYIGNLDHEAIICKKLGYQNEENVVFIKLSLTREERNHLTELLEKLKKLNES